MRCQWRLTLGLALAVLVLVVSTESPHNGRRGHQTKQPLLVRRQRQEQRANHGSEEEVHRIHGCCKLRTTWAFCKWPNLKWPLKHDSLLMISLYVRITTSERGAKKKANARKAPMFACGCYISRKCSTEKVHWCSQIVKSTSLLGQYCTISSRNKSTAQ